MIGFVLLSCISFESWGADRVQIDRLRLGGGSVAALWTDFPDWFPNWYLADVASRLNTAVDSESLGRLSAFETKLFAAVLQVAEARCHLVDPALSVGYFSLESQPSDTISWVDEDLPLVASVFSRLERTKTFLQLREQRCSRSVPILGFWLGLTSSLYYFGQSGEVTESVDGVGKMMASVAFAAGAGVVSYLLDTGCRSSDVDHFAKWMERPSLVFASLFCQCDLLAISLAALRRAEEKQAIQILQSD